MALLDQVALLAAQAALLAGQDAFLAQSLAGQTREEGCSRLLERLAPFDRHVLLAFVQRACSEGDAAESLDAFTSRLVHAIDARPPQVQTYVPNLARPPPLRPPKKPKTPEQKETLLLRRLDRLRRSRTEFH